MKYRELLKRGKEVIEEMKIPHKVNRAEKQMELEVIDRESDLADKEFALENAKGADPINVKEIIRLTDEVDSIKRDLKIVNSVKKELFGK